MYPEIGSLGVDWSHANPATIIGGMILIIVISYAIGNLNPSIIQAKIAGVDIRKEGSGNPGTTNTLRVLGKKAAVITLLVDIGKGVLAVVIAGRLFGLLGAETACVAVFLGHVYPVFFGFKGGKGVATAFGALAALHPILGFGCLAVVVLTVIITGYVSMGSITGAVAAPILSFIILGGFWKAALVMALVVIWRHRSNIQRLRNHEESKLSFGKGTKEQ